MITVRLSRQALADVEGTVVFLASENAALALRTARLLGDASAILTRHPQIGWPVRGELRELVISTGRTGYVALYRYRASREEIDVLAICHQRQAGYGA